MSNMLLKSLNKLLLVLLFTNICYGKEILKREASGISYAVQHQGTGTGFGWDGVGWPERFYGNSGADFTSKFGTGGGKLAYHLGPGPSEIAAAISAAKEASAAVAEAQKRVQIAKDDVLAQQHIASQKEAEAALALQKAEAAAAVHRQQASAAANAVIAAQQRLAQAKADVAEKQQIAAAKEADAAALINQNAAAAALQVQKSDFTAAKLAALQQSSAAVTLKHAAITKEATLGATSAALAAAKGLPEGHHPWHFTH
ncbi:uncharacterized protein LOC108733577 [Agrilus planipennis]|uniref:Uncharacterized protein LOC108733577 n=1 Tax=Agrilus planipennis TaxID=224129 RepID=A0A1W4WII8_AGRPL|nr:uncharacterized protein LOC108733577 [Agrilus planipennis]XP_018320273.1 uncharacterized protein LOC108733577 [Agrilus planipennis]